MGKDLLFTSRDARADLFLEAKYLIEDQFPDCSDDMKLTAIVGLVSAYAQLFSAEKIANEISSGISELSTVIAERDS